MRLVRRPVFFSARNGEKSINFLGFVSDIGNRTVLLEHREKLIKDEAQ